MCQRTAFALVAAGRIPPSAQTGYVCVYAALPSRIHLARISPAQPDQDARFKESAATARADRDRRGQDLQDDEREHELDRWNGCEDPVGGVVAARPNLGHPDADHAEEHAAERQSPQRGNRDLAEQAERYRIGRCRFEAKLRS